MEKTIQEYNKRCAKFIGGRNKDSALVGISKRMGENDWWLPLFGITTEKQMKFHSDWNWIMKVILEINMLPNPKNQSDTTLQTYRTNVQSTLKSANKEAVMESINKFLIWHEQNNATPQ